MMVRCAWRPGSCSRPRARKFHRRFCLARLRRGPRQNPGGAVLRPRWARCYDRCESRRLSPARPPAAFRPRPLPCSASSNSAAPFPSRRLRRGELARAGSANALPLGPGGVQNGRGDLRRERAVHSPRFLPPLVRPRRRHIARQPLTSCLQRPAWQPTERIA